MRSRQFEFKLQLFNAGIHLVADVINATKLGYSRTSLGLYMTWPAYKPTSLMLHSLMPDSRKELYLWPGLKFQIMVLTRRAIMIVFDASKNYGTVSLTIGYCLAGNSNFILSYECRIPSVKFNISIHPTSCDVKPLCLCGSSSTIWYQ